MRFRAARIAAVAVLALPFAAVGAPAAVLAMPDVVGAPLAPTAEAASSIISVGAAPLTPARFAAVSVVDEICIPRASAEFVARVKAHLRENVPEPILRDMLADGYHIEINSRIRQGREKQLHEDNDYIGGFHSYGKEKFIVIAEMVRGIKSKKWRESDVWENGVNHEIGHAEDYILGISQSPGFRLAWRKDYQRIPARMKVDPGDGKRNSTFHYFLHPDEDGRYRRARQEAFAEGFDVLLRGRASKFNYENFTRYFPRALAEIRTVFESYYGPIFR